ncbi:UvrD-helicase domain-containing protein [Desulfitobacterium metallireducens]|uniref:ATP-dependent helicase/nuclease subunit A n=1 Tax=Desulfitobacterium metallireducens DSM 15288 TaxID=871968 RepID=W0E7M5_9FIRM|nr:UvrD-helicase domain-containing protein [Desulfitobacterium metallireducens]AHF06860.1 ATP-dependent helicase [Desulfitobacterium metallireducens DSM 15288]
MSEPKWTVEQQAAIELKGQLLVAAAAGSGKTAVLVERLIRRIIDPKAGVDVDQFLVLTFTKAAANEMHERIGKALEDALFKETDSAEVEHLLHQRALLNRASITTIHSFCMELLRQNFYRLELDPAFRVADQAEADLLRQDIVEDLFEALYDEESAPFQALVEAFGSDRDDQPLMEIVLKLYEFSTSQVDPHNWLENLAFAYNWRSTDELIQSPWGESVRQGVKDKVEESIALLERAYQISIQPGGPKHYASCLLEDLDRLQHLSKTLKEGIWGEIEVQFQESSKFPKLPAGSRKKKETGIDAEELSLSEEFQTALREEAKKARDNVKKKLDKLSKDLFQFPLEEQLPRLQKMGELIETLATVVQEFAQQYGRAKRQRNIVDFSDLEHFALRLLEEQGEDEEDETSTSVARALQKRFAEVMVDEYQDINPVQERILQLVSRQEGPSPNLFMVGDVKQSIYRFRMADPSLFLEKYMELPHWTSELTPSQEQKLVIDLNRNFRSRQEVIDGVNYLFRQIMTSGAGEIPYDDQAALCYGANFISGHAEIKTAEGPIEVHLFDPKTLKQTTKETLSANLDQDQIQEQTQDISQGESEMDEGNEEKEYSQEDMTLEDLESARLEARLVANRIQQIIQGREFQIYDKNLQDFRATQYSDIVILMRSFSAIAPLYVEEFQALGIPVYAETSSGYFGASEVETMLSLLKIIDNPRLDIPLAAVLRSPFVGMNGTELGKMRSVLPQGDFYESFVLVYSAALELERMKQEQHDAEQQEQENPFISEIPDVLEEYAKSWPQLLTQAYQVLNESPNLKNKVLYFYRKLQVYRQMARQMSLADLLWEIYEDTGYLAYVGTLPSGPQRQANLRALYDRACRFEATNYRGLFRFLRFLDRFQGQGKDLGSARALGENEDVVRLITVHASKGLEFPVVFFVGLGKKFNTRSLSGNLLLHSTLGVGIPLIDFENRVRYPSFIQTGIKERLWQESLAEELRILYVALTRAKERLFLYGSLSKIPEIIKQWQSLASCITPAFPDGQLRSARSFMDWIGPALARHPQNFFDESVKPELLDSSSQWLVQVHEHLVIPSAEKREGQEQEQGEYSSENETEFVAERSLEEWFQLVDERLNYHYAYPEAVHQAAKTSVSELKRRFAWHKDDLADTPVEKRLSQEYTRPKFLQISKKLTPAERGTAFHAVMEHLPLQDWSKNWSAFSGEEQEIHIGILFQSLLKREILTLEQVETLSIKQIANYINSPLGMRLLTAKEVRREVPFTLTLFLDTPTECPEEADRGCEGILVQGVIDALVLSSDRKSAEIVDYKTDQIKFMETPEKTLVERYALQLSIYSLAVERLLQIRVDQATLYSVDLSCEIPIPEKEIRAQQEKLKKTPIDLS